MSKQQFPEKPMIQIDTEYESLSERGEIQGYNDCLEETNANGMFDALKAIYLMTVDSNDTVHQNIMRIAGNAINKTNQP
jgi:hypothetical protein